MLDQRSDLEKINDLYLAYARTTLPKGKGWFLFVAISLGLLVLVPTILHRAFKLPLFHNEMDIVHILANLIGIVLMAGVMIQGLKKRGAPQLTGAPQKFVEYQPIIRSLRTFPEKELRHFIDLQKEEWAEADKDAETSAPALIVLATLMTTFANWGNQAKAPFAMILILIVLLFFIIAHSRKRLVQLRRFEYFVQQALIQQEVRKSAELNPVLG